MRHPKLLLSLALAASPALAAPGASAPAKPAVAAAPPSVSTAPPATTPAPASLSKPPKKVVLPTDAPSDEAIKMAIPRARVQLPKLLRNPDGTLGVKRRLVKDGRPSWWRRMRMLVENPSALKKG